MLKYKEFVSLNEGSIGDFFRGVGNLITGAKPKIKNLVEKLVTLEKTFIDQSDEMQFSVFRSQAPSKSQEDAIISRQQASMSQRALDALTRAKNAEANVINNEVAKICGKDARLIAYYKGLLAGANTEVAKYAYEKAKTHRDSAYTDSLYSQLKSMEASRQEVERYAAEQTQGEEKNAPKRPAKLRSEVYQLPYSEFKSAAQGMDSQEIIRLVADGDVIILQLNTDYKEQMDELKGAKKGFVASKDEYGLEWADKEKQTIERNYQELKSDIEDKMAFLRRIKKK
jgi:hypothetical protein